MKNDLYDWLYDWFTETEYHVGKSWCSELWWLILNSVHSRRDCCVWEAKDEVE